MGGHVITLLMCRRVTAKYNFDIKHFSENSSKTKFKVKVLILFLVGGVMALNFITFAFFVPKPFI